MYSEIDIEDLHDPESSAGIALEMQDRQRYFEGRAIGQDDDGQEKVAKLLGIYCIT